MGICEILVKSSPDVVRAIYPVEIGVPIWLLMYSRVVYYTAKVQWEIMHAI